MKIATSISRISITLAAVVFSIAAYAQPFITTWKTNNPGVSNSNQITIPTDDLTSVYDIVWQEVGVPANNGTLTGQSGPVTITFPTPGIYGVAITGNFTHIYFYNDNLPSDHEKILTVQQWGSIAWGSMFGAFTNCVNLTVPAVDVPDLSNVTIMSMMFQGASLANPNMGGWDVSNVEDMFGLFQFANSFNHDISAWDVSNVTQMRAMFANTPVFNQDISGWDVSNVSNFSAMFFNADVFNAPIGSWSTGNATTMEGMFASANVFNRDIGNWDVSNVQDMTGMFLQATSFNQNIGAWNVGAVTAMSSMFSGAGSFNGDIGNWNTSSATTMEEMFFNATAFNRNIGAWDVSNVTNMKGVFHAASSFNQPIGTWDVSNVVDMQEIFFVATLFNQDLTAWNVGNVTNMYAMFEWSSFNQPIGNWDVSNVTSMRGMFFSTPFNQDLSAWDVGNVTDFSVMFIFSQFNQDISNWNVSSATTMQAMFSGTAFNQDIGSWDVGNVIDMGQMFSAATSFKRNIGNWNVSSVTNMSGMFDGATSFNQDISGWNTANVTNMTNMLNNTALSLLNYNAFLISLAEKNLNTAVALGANGLTYCSAETARQTLVVSRNWTITGDTKGCLTPPPPLFVPVMNVVRNDQPLAEGTSVLFPKTGVGLSTNQVFRIKNIGTGSLVVTDVQLTGDAFTFVGTIPPPIPPGDSSSFEIRFEPSDLILYTGTMSIFSNGELPVYSLNISGEGDADVEVYNVVTVNKNGKHDFLNIRNIELFPKNRVTIYDRWGNLVFEREGYNNIDETFAGASGDNKSLPEGTYYYVIDKNNGAANKTGFLLLRR